MDSVALYPLPNTFLNQGVIRSVMKMADSKQDDCNISEGGRRWDGRPKPLI